MELGLDEVTPMTVLEMEITGTQVPQMQNPVQPVTSRFLTLAAVRLKSLLRSAAVFAAKKRKVLAVRETAALGDRRFVSVVQFERQRFLIGSSPSSITLLSRLPDDPANRVETGNQAGERI